MKEIVKILKLNKSELGIIVNALHDLRSKLNTKKKETDYVDDLLLKVLNAPEKKRCLNHDSAYMR